MDPAVEAGGVSPLAPPALAPALSSASLAPATDGELCVVCCEQARSHAFIPCGHLSLCFECAELYLKAPEDHAWRKQGCPVCRASYTTVMKIFRS